LIIGPIAQQFDRPVFDGVALPDQLLPTVIDQNPCAHFRLPIDMIFHGRSCSVLQA
jgi:hypothetical protein